MVGITWAAWRQRSRAVKFSKMKRALLIERLDFIAFCQWQDRVTAWDLGGRKGRYPRSWAR